MGQIFAQANRRGLHCSNIATFAAGGRSIQALAALDLIRTTRKEKLPKGFSYPVGAEVISQALAGVPQFHLASITFVWKDTFWASRYQERIRSAGAINIFEVNLDLWKDWRIFVHAVPAAHSQSAREQLSISLPSLAAILRRTPSEPEHFRWSATYDLAGCSLAISS